MSDRDSQEQLNAEQKTDAPKSSAQPIMVSQKKKTNTAEHGIQLFSSVSAVLKIVLTLGCIVTAVWLFVSINPMTEQQEQNSGAGLGVGINMTDRHIPKPTQQALNASLNAIRYQDFHWSVDDSSELYQNSLKQLADCSDYNEVSFAKLASRGQQINQHISDLNLTHSYGLDMAKFSELVCKNEIRAKVVSKVMTNYLQSKNDFLKLDWLEISKRNFDPSTATTMVSISNRFLAKESPWQGLTGCTYLTDNSLRVEAETKLATEAADTASNRVLYLGRQSEKKDMLCNYQGIRPQSIAESTAAAPSVLSANDEDIYLPPNLNLMLSDLSLLQKPSGAQSLQQEFDSQLHEQKSWWQKLVNKKDNTIHYAGVDIPVGYSSNLTLDPYIQNQAQKLALCATNQLPTGESKSSFCKGLFSSSMFGDSANMYEDALVRRVGIAIIDVQTQEIKALASSHSACYAKDNGDRSINKTDCPQLWQPQNGGDKLLNHAVFANEAPGSTIKPTQALAIVREFPNQFVNNQQGRALLARNISKSSTKSIIDHLTCQTYSSQFNNGQCNGYQALAQAASDVGLNSSCTGSAQYCSAMDLLFGVPDTGADILKRRYFAGKLLINNKTNQPYMPLSFSRKTIDQCLDKTKRITSTRCSNEAIANALRDSWGRNNVKASPVGIASTFTHMMAAANGDEQIRSPHLVRDIWNIKNETITPRAWRDANNGRQALNIEKRDARITLELMKDGISTGTAKRSCASTLGNCADLRGQIYGKTGTPSYKGTSAATVNRLCFKEKRNATVCQFRPLKWYVYGTKDSNDSIKPWKYAVAVMVERNWYQNGRLDDAGDGNSKAAQIGLMLYPTLKRIQK